nr:unnamed protein product [Digitaria exilis]
MVRIRRRCVPQPAPKDNPWRYMPNNAMTPHISGTTIDGQLRYAAGVKDMLERYFKGQDFPAQNYIVKEGSWWAACCCFGHLCDYIYVNRHK